MRKADDAKISAEDGEYSSRSGQVRSRDVMTNAEATIVRRRVIWVLSVHGFIDVGGNAATGLSEIGE